VLYINSVDMESLTGPEALSRAITITFSTTTAPTATDVHFKVSSFGITLTDNKHRLTLISTVACVYRIGYRRCRLVSFLDPETGLQALRTLFLFLVLLLVLKLFHFTTDRRQTPDTDWWQYYTQSLRVGFSSWSPN